MTGCGMIITGGRFAQQFGSDFAVLRVNTNGTIVWSFGFNLNETDRVFETFAAVGIAPEGIQSLRAFQTHPMPTGDTMGDETQIVTIKQQVTPLSRNTLPVVRIDQPQPGDRFGLGQEVTIVATAADAERPVANVEFLVGNRVIATAKTLPFESSGRSTS
ncbi:MAG: hypothetical protein M2R45_04019 [Verrucomicrobia subdivision 3 bacterium]|nr:hypothetical protein [Limisphaerales bacterium]MCS1416230.1 hypothetical protein [Limisphaerales bacterium]